MKKHNNHINFAAYGRRTPDAPDVAPVMWALGVGMKRMTTISAYVYWPLLYFVVYMPFVVPRLDRWHHIPFWITWLAIIGFISILAACGVRKSHRAICFHAFGMSFFLQGFIFAMSRLSMPGFLKSYEASFMPDAAVPVLIVGTAAVGLGEIGHFITERKERASNQVVVATS